MEGSWETKKLRNAEIETLGNGETKKLGNQDMQK
jgi:hypothetical protein